MHARIILDVIFWHLKEETAEKGGGTAPFDHTVSAENECVPSIAQATSQPNIKTP